MSESEIIQRILLKYPSLTHAEVLKAIERKKVAFGGFLTDDAATRLVAAEYQVETKVERTLQKINICQLTSGLSDVTVSGRVLVVNTSKAFLKSKVNKREIARMSIADKTGTIKAVLWRNQARVADSISAGQIVLISHGYVRKSKYGELEIHVGERGKVQTGLPEMAEDDYPLIEDFCCKIGNIVKSRSVNVKGLIRKLYPLHSFKHRNGANGKLVRTILEDETGQIPVLFWDEKAEALHCREKHTTLLLLNVEAKRDTNGLLELHVGRFSNVEILKKQSEDPLR